MELLGTELAGCFRLHPPLQKDERGTFLKTFHSERFSELGLPIEWCEEYYSSSVKGVIRGMHFRTPPHDHHEIVYCMSGRVLDVVLDLRRQSTTFGAHISIELNGAAGDGIVITTGMAHGFMALTEDVVMAYKVTSVYSPHHDKGVRWDSFGCNWGNSVPILSARDKSHPRLSDFNSPF